MRDCLPLTWYPRDSELLVAICKDWKFDCMLDLFGGEGAAVKAQLTIGKPIVTLCWNQAHVSLLKEVANTKVVELMLTAGHKFKEGFKTELVQEVDPALHEWITDPSSRDAQELPSDDSDTEPHPDDK